MLRAGYSLWVKFIPPPADINKNLLEHKHTHSYQGFFFFNYNSKGESLLWTIWLVLHTKNFDNPWSTLLHHHGQMLNKHSLEGWASFSVGDREMQDLGPGKSKENKEWIPRVKDLDLNCDSALYKVPTLGRYWVSLCVRSCICKTVVGLANFDQFIRTGNWIPYYPAQSLVQVRKKTTH